MRVLDRIRALFRPKARPRPTLVREPGGFQVRPPSAAPSSAVRRVGWRDVSRVTAFKRDLLSTDLVCLAFELSDGTAIEVDEEMAGWEELLEQLPEALPGALHGARIFEAVLQPPFARNETLVFARDGERAR